MKFKEKIESIYIDKMNQRMISQNFEIASLSMQNVMANYLKEDKLKTLISKYVETYKKAIDELKTENKKYEDILIERLYVDNYFFFEETISECLKTLYNFYPKFLNKTEIVVDFDDLYEQDKIEFIRQNVIDNKVKSMIQSSNTFSILKKFNSIFGIEVNIDTKTLNQLFIISQNRNLLVHNKGIVSNIYLWELKNKKIKSELNLGEYILNEFDDHNGIRESWKIIKSIIYNITNEIKKNEIRLNKYHKNLNIK
jgi:hypothetical protein